MDPAPRQPSLRPSNQKEKAGRLPRRLRPAKREDTSFLPKTRDRTRPLQLRYHERKRARRLHLLSLLRAEVHLLQLRVGCVSARTGARGIWRLCAARSPHAISLAPRDRLPGRRHAQQHGSAICAVSLLAFPAGPGRKPPSKPRPAASRPKGARLGAAGINRVCLGVQSFVAREIARTGRKHTAEIVAAEVALLRDAGIDNINIDLIAGPFRPDEASLARIAGLGRAPGAGARFGLHAGSG